MYKIKYYNGIVKQDTMKIFKKPKGLNLFEHACNCNSLEEIIAISYLLCPDFIQIGEYILFLFFSKKKERKL